MSERIPDTFITFFAIAYPLSLAGSKRLLDTRAPLVSTWKHDADSGSRDPAALQRKIEAHLAKPLGYDVFAFVRTDAEVAAIARYHPFGQKEMESAVAFNVAFLAEPMDAAAARSVLTFKTEIDDFHVHGRDVYWLCRKKQSESTFSNEAFAKTPKRRATFRGMNTIKKLAAKHFPELFRTL
jgi:uncharacterized protein (DUF1697 family)